MGRDGLFPRRATRVNERGTPVFALFMTVVLIGAFTMSGTSDQVLAADVLLAASLYVITFTSFLVLRRRKPQATGPYKAPLYPVIPGLALLSVAAIVASIIISDHRSALVVAGLLAISWPASRIVQRLIGRPRGEAARPPPGGGLQC